VEEKDLESFDEDDLLTSLPTQAVMLVLVLRYMPRHSLRLLRVEEMHSCAPRRAAVMVAPRDGCTRRPSRLPGQNHGIVQRE
jgi:hypothetical protein